MNKNLILVDENDRAIGQMEKLPVHEQGSLHRAFSIFIFNTKGELLLQQRANKKYHSAGLWSNTCCSHPYYGEETYNAAVRRLKEEMGLTCELKHIFSFIYRTDFENGLIEHEYDHVYAGFTDDLPHPSKDEVKDWKYTNISDLKKDLRLNPGNYSEWLKICFPKMKKYLKKINPSLF
jgi:isopentenyl-diphosphate Delta-isomerase